MLFAVADSVPVAWVYIAAFALAALAAMVFYHVWQRVADRHDRASHLSAACNEIGLTTIAEILHNYSVGKIVEAASGIQELVRRAHGPEGPIVLVHDCIRKALPMLLKTASWREWVARELAAANAAATAAAATKTA